MVGLELRKLSCCQNQHWSLYSSHCSPCLANYTYILQQEDRREEELVLRLTGIADLVGGNHIVNPTRGGNTTAVMQVNLYNKSRQLKGDLCFNTIIRLSDIP